MRSFFLATLTLLAAACGDDATPDPGQQSATTASRSASRPEGVCERIPQVRDRIVEISGVESCDMVTQEHLAGVSALSLRGAGVGTLPEGTFAGLSGLQSLDLSGNDLATLPTAGAFTGLSSLRSLDLDYNALTALPDQAFVGLPNLESLSLEGNAVTVIPEGVFAGLSNLESLSLRGNAVSTLPNAGFAELSSLQSLDLENNDLTTLPEGVFAGLSNLDSLFLGGNAVTTVAEGVFAGLSNLEYLSLYDNATPREDSWCGDQQRIALTFQDDKTHSICEQDGVLTYSYGYLDGAPEIRYSGKILVNLENEGGLRSASVGILADLAESTSDSEGRTLLAELACAANTNGFVLLSEVQGYVDRRSVYDRYVFRNNGWQYEVSAEYWEYWSEDGEFWENVDEVDSPVGRAVSPDSQVHCQSGDATPDPEQRSATMASGSTTRPEGVCERIPQVRDRIVQTTGAESCEMVTEEHLAGVRVLDLSSNGLTTLPEGVFAGLSRLESLSLNGNGLTTLPEGVFAGLSRLESLSLNGNDLTTLPEGVFAGLSRLESLSFLTTLPEGVFAGLTRLESLSLDDNALTTLPEGVFAGLSNLESLSLSGSGLTTLSEGVFAGLSSVRSVDLDGNALTMLSEGDFAALPSLRRLNLADNPGSPFVLELLLPDSWCTVQQRVAINFRQDRKTASICEKDGVLTYSYGRLDGEPELRYSGRVLASIAATGSIVGGRDSEVHTENLARLADWNTDPETSDLLRELADAPTTGGFVVLNGLTGFTSSVRYIFRNGGWQYEISAVGGRTFNVPEGSAEYEELANYQEYDLTVRPPEPREPR